MADDLALAHRLADVADDITAARFTSRDLTVNRKADGSEVTDADVQVEEALRAIVAEQRPRDSFLSEELGLHEREASRTWIVDGIDGTRSFVAGASTWGTLIALQEHGHILVGVASSPGLRARWWAARRPGRLDRPRPVGRPSARSTPRRVGPGVPGPGACGHGATTGRSSRLAA
jgi:histidinol-phosphatase